MSFFQPSIRQNWRGGRRGRGRGRGGERGRGGRRDNHSNVPRPIGYGLLKTWNNLDDFDELLIQLTASKELVTQLLSKSDLKDDWILEILNIFSKVCQAGRSQNQVAMLALLRGSEYIKTCIRRSIVLWGLTATPEENISNVNSLLILIEKYFKYFPSCYMDMPLDELAMFIRDHLSRNKEIVSKVNALIVSRREQLRKNITSTARRPVEQFTNEPPPDNFREISTVPNVDDIHREDKPYLRPIKAKGGYVNGEEYLDVQFRLLREDLVSPLREGVREIIEEVPRKERRHALNVYNSVQVLYPLCTKNGIIHRVCFDTTHTKAIPWQHSKRLIFGTLVCLSKDQFGTIIFATVADRSPDNLRKGFIDLRFVGGLEVESYFQKGEVMDMVESSVYFEAYKHVLNGMKEFDTDDIPMQKYIVECNSDVIAPAYLRNRSLITPRYNLRSSLNTKQLVADNVRVLNEKAWPSYEQTDFNKSQLNAFKHAITKEFVVIQGPPGTGKTHVGIRIADALLKNKTAWNADERTPMLIVCYTNHALDQFLNGIIEFGHDNVIRVGGRANEMMQKYSLRNALTRLKGVTRDRRNTKDEFRFLRRAKAQALEERDNLIGKIEPSTNAIKTSQDRLQSGTLVHFRQLQPHMKQEHQDLFEHYDGKCLELKMSIFDIFLNIIRIPIANIMNINIMEETTENSFKQVLKASDGTNTSSASVENEEMEEAGDEQVKIDGEGEVLVERWAADTKEYETIQIEKKIEKDEFEQRQNNTFVDEDGFKYVQPRRHEKKKRVQQLLRNHDAMTLEEANAVDNPWHLSIENRCRLYKFWLQRLHEEFQQMYSRKAGQLEDVCERIKELQQQEDEIAMKKADVIAMTTTCAARYRRILGKIGTKVVIIEEAAEVLEAHVMTSLSRSVEHLILIGDHQQLKPNPAVFELATRYSLEVSLFQRMVDNGMECHTLDIQHRMRPEISVLLRHIYPNLKDHESVRSYPRIKGVNQNVMFINHHEKEHQVMHMKSKANAHEAEFIKSLCFYFLQQGYQPSQITILTGYTGQLIQLKNVMPRNLFDGVRVTAVDNFQGEENDIILLSLVRSNDQANIGFLKTDNRICVALSRAKHGLFVIGNFDILQQKSPMWKKVIADAYRNRSYGNTLQLCCQNHPTTSILAKKANDFLEAPEGGCIKPCEFRLECGHVCEKACHPIDPDHIEYVCKKSCSKITCKFAHRCPKRCHHGKECGPCMTIVRRVIPQCYHVQNMKCKDNPIDVPCESKCEKKLTCGHPCALLCKEDCQKQKCFAKVEKILPCGHSQSVYCSTDIVKVQCKTRCQAELDCNHPCPGTCGGCKQNRLHQKCSRRCGRILVCSHGCEGPCTKNCPPCLLPCENRCVHSKCKKRCGALCTPCMEVCTWRCRHKHCTKLCSEVCDRDPCNEPCRMVLSCGHRCIGLCGEICPTLCRVCDKEKVQEIFFGDEDEPFARFIILEDCKHFFEVKGLDQWMNQNNGDVKMKECPRCKTIIRKSVRYGNIVKNTLQDINKIKKQIIQSGSLDLDTVKEEAYHKCRDVNMLMEGLPLFAKYRFKLPRQINEALKNNENVHLYARTIRYQINLGFRENNASILAASLVKTALGFESINAVLHQAKLLEALWKLKIEILENESLKSDKWEILESKDIIDLEAFIMKEGMNEQQLRDASEDLDRQHAYVNVISCKNELKQKSKQIEEWKATLSITDGEIRSKAQDWLIKARARLKEVLLMQAELMKMKKVKSLRVAELKRSVEEIKKRYKLNGLAEQEKIMVVKAIGLGKGHWYKCPNGHFYAIGNCGGATERGKCPDCGATVGGSGHALAAGNQHAGEFDGSRYAAYSEEANNMLNWDQEELRRLQLR